MSDSYTEVTETSFFGNIKSAIAGVFLAPVLILGACYLIWWNEGRILETYLSLKEGAGAVMEVDGNSVNPNNNKKLIHISEKATTDESLADEMFGLQLAGLRLQRSVEMYQWKETRRTRNEKKVGGGTRKVTTFDYNKVWSNTLIRSNSFKKKTYVNPTQMPIMKQNWNADKVTVGQFILDNNLKNKLKNFQPVGLDQVQTIPPVNGIEGQRNGEYIYYGNAGAAEVGDVRVSFKVVNPYTVSIVAQQNGENLGPYRSSNGKNIQILEKGFMSSKAMFDKAQSENTILAWILRGVGFLFILIGFKMLMGPIVALSNIIPFFGDIADYGTGLVAGVFAFPLTMIVIGVSWIGHRPVVGASALALSLVGLFYFIKARKEKKAKMKNVKPIKKAKKRSKVQAEPLGEVEYILHGKGKTHGPYSGKKILSFLNKGKVKLTTRASVVGEDEKIRVADIVQDMKKAG